MTKLPKPYRRCEPSLVTVRRVGAEGEQVVAPDHFGYHLRPSRYSCGPGNVTVEVRPLNIVLRVR